MVKQLTAIIEKEDDGYVTLCPKVDVASQGDTVGEARKNLKEALEVGAYTAQHLLVRAVDLVGGPFNDELTDQLAIPADSITV